MARQTTTTCQNRLARGSASRMGGGDGNLPRVHPRASTSDSKEGLRSAISSPQPKVCYEEEVRQQIYVSIRLWWLELSRFLWHVGKRKIVADRLQNKPAP